MRDDQVRHTEGCRAHRWEGTTEGRYPGTFMANMVRRVLGGTACCTALLAAAGCASGPVRQVRMTVSCDRLFETAPEGTSVRQEDMPALLNARYVLGQVPRYYEGRRPRRAVLQLLVRADGTVSHGCVLERSGDGRFDSAALQAARAARFRPATVDGEPVAAWVVLPIMLGSR